MLDRTRPSWPPDYSALIAWRLGRLEAMRTDAVVRRGARLYYADPAHAAEFIGHWCDTFDPRNAGVEGRMSRMPFVLFPRQVDFVEFIVACLMAEASGLSEKSRDMGATWLAICVSVWMFLFVPGVSIGWGSRKAELVDKIGDMSSIFEKMRWLLRALPRYFLPPDLQMMHMKVYSESLGSSIIGEGGDDIGRGGRTRIYFLDEAAHLEHPESVEASLSENTRVRIDISSVNGLGNVFHRKRGAGIDWYRGREMKRGETYVFVLDWRDHPEKTEEWYSQKERKFSDDGLLHVFRQEVDRNYSASVAGVIIPAEWVSAAVDAHVRLDLGELGAWGAALDVADEGGDTNALVRRKGVVLRSCDEWGDCDTGETARRAVAACDRLGALEMQYDCVGVGAGVKSEANRLKNEGLMPRGLSLVPWDAGAGVQDPMVRVIDGDEESPLNGDFYHNFKAQAWWSLRRRFYLTWRAVSDPTFLAWHVDELISLSSAIPLLAKLKKELSQVVRKPHSGTMKLLIDKRPKGTRSPNLADAVVMAYFPVRLYEPPQASFALWGSTSGR